MPVQSFVGLRHYRYFATDPEFWSSFYYGVVYAGVTMVLQLGLGVAAALLLNEAFRGRNAAARRGAVPLHDPDHRGRHPVEVVAQRLLRPREPPALVAGFVQAPVAWLGKDYIMSSLIITSVWQFFPFVVVTYLARLQTIPPELYEAARVDGATVWRRFLHVTLPQTKNVLFVIVLLRGIWMFTKFDTVWLMAGDGAVSRYIRTLPIYAYARSFTYLQAGMGAALAVMMFGMLLVATGFYFRLFRDEEAAA